MARNWEDIITKATEANGEWVTAFTDAKAHEANYARKLGLMAMKVRGEDTLMVKVKDPSNPPKAPNKVGRPKSGEFGTVDESKFSDDVKLRLDWLRTATDDELREGPPAWLTTQERAARIHATNPGVQEIVDKINHSSDEEIRAMSARVNARLKEREESE